MAEQFQSCVWRVLLFLSQSTPLSPYTLLMITITEEHLEELKTPNGGYTKATLQALGISINNNPGWKKFLIGKTFPDEQYQIAIEGRFKRVSKKNNKSHRHDIDKICISGKWYRLVEIV